MKKYGILSANEDFVYKRRTCVRKAVKLESSVTYRRNMCPKSREVGEFGNILEEYVPEK